MNIDVTIIKDIPVKQINTFEDLVVKGIARGTLDMTAGHFPRLTGDLERGSYAMSVVGSNKSYGIGTTVDYAKYVWNNPKIKNWTNPNTYSEWYLTTLKNKQEHIVNQAVSSAKGVL